MSRRYNIKKLTSRAVFEALQPHFSQVQFEFLRLGNPPSREFPSRLYMEVLHYGTSSNIQMGQLAKTQYPYFDFAQTRKPDPILLTYTPTNPVSFSEQLNHQLFRRVERAIEGRVFKLEIRLPADPETSVIVYNKSTFHIVVDRPVEGMVLPETAIQPSGGWYQYIPGEKTPGGSRARGLIERVTYYEDDLWRKGVPTATQNSPEESKRIENDIETYLGILERGFPALFKSLETLL